MGMNTLDLIKKYSNDRGLSVVELGEAADVRFQNIYRWKEGGDDPSIASLKKIANVLHVNYKNLLPDDEFANETKHDTIRLNLIKEIESSSLTEKDIRLLQGMVNLLNKENLNSSHKGDEEVEGR